MELIQTINCGDDFSLLDFQLTEIMDSGLSGIRLNLNKYIQSSEIDSLSRLFEIVFKYKERYKFLYDLPFPYNKTRIMEYKIMGNNIKKDEVYTLYFNQNDFIKAQENAILLSKSKNSYNNSKVVYYGDGQGAFEKVNETKDRVVLKAICDFQIYKRKSITYGKGSINDKIEPVLNMIGDVCSTLDYGCALSLVENEKDLSEFMNLTDKKIQLVSKIETNESINNLEEIVKRSDGIMLARGDLALLNPYYNLFQTLDDIIKMAKHYHNPSKSYTNGIVPEPNDSKIAFAPGLVMQISDMQYNLFILLTKLSNVQFSTNSSLLFKSLYKVLFFPHTTIKCICLALETTSRIKSKKE